jgi:hypothetical protein
LDERPIPQSVSAMHLKNLSSHFYQVVLPSVFLMPILIACTLVRPQANEPKTNPQPPKGSTRSTTETRGAAAEKPKCTANICVDSKPGAVNEIGFFKQHASLLEGKASDFYADDVDGFQDRWTYHRFKINEAHLQELTRKLDLTLDDLESCQKSTMRSHTKSWWRPDEIVNKQCYDTGKTQYMGTHSFDMTYDRDTQIVYLYLYWS